MRKLILNECYFYKKVTYTLVSYEKIGVVIKVTMENSTSQFYHPSNWRTFKKYIQ